MTDKEILKAQKEFLNKLLDKYPLEYMDLTDDLNFISRKYNIEQGDLANKFIRPLTSKDIIKTTPQTLGTKIYDKYRPIEYYNIKGHLTENGFNYLRLLKDNKNKDFTFYLSIFSIIIATASFIYNTWDKEYTKNTNLQYKSELKKELLDSVQQKANHLFDSLTKKKP